MDEPGTRGAEPAMTDVPIKTFDSREDLAQALAGDVAGRLRAAIESRGAATLAVSGGSTPKRFFQVLSETDLDWPKVTVVLVDERFVPETDERSNARLVRELLLQCSAAAARFIGLYGPATSADAAAAKSADMIDALARPFDVAILGMGTDGHTASFFPNGTTLEDALSDRPSRSVIAIEAPGAGEPRLTLTFPHLAKAGYLVLHIEGDAKKATLDAALRQGPETEMPIRALLRRAPTPPVVYWAE
jgi:6-phosphogluconolactonase